MWSTLEVETFQFSIFPSYQVNLALLRKTKYDAQTQNDLVRFLNIFVDYNFMLRIPVDSICFLHGNLQFKEIRFL